MRLEQNYPHIHQVVADMAANNGTINGKESMPLLFRRVADCVESRLMTRAEMIDLDEWLSRLSPEEMRCLTCGDPDDAIDLLLDSPEAASGDRVGEVLADIFHVV